jgi:hemerythrin-like metal-binding protein
VSASAPRVRIAISTDAYESPSDIDCALPERREGPNGATTILRSNDSSEASGGNAAAGFPLQWRPEYECGHALIDEQHRTLYRNANALLEASHRRAPEVLARFDELISHVIGHFAGEERVLLETGYPRYAEHRRIHRELVEKAMRLRDEMLEGHHRHEKLLEFLLKDMIERHLRVEDEAYFPSLAER